MIARANGDADAALDESWAQRTDEPNRWYQRFLTYADLPADRRSVRSAWVASLKHPASVTPQARQTAPASPSRRKARGTPRDWLDRSRRHEWDGRAADRDAARRADDERVIAELRVEWAESRRQLITASTASVRSALAALDVTGRDRPGLGEVIRAMARLFALQRQELDGTVTDLRVTIGGPFLTSETFNRDERDILKQLLDDEIRARNIDPLEFDDGTD